MKGKQHGSLTAEYSPDTFMFGRKKLKIGILGPKEGQRAFSERKLPTQRINSAK